MKFNSDSISKLTDIFAFKYYEVIGAPNYNPRFYKLISDVLMKEKVPPSFSNWMKYLEGVGCRIVVNTACRKTHYIYIDDACHADNKIEIPKEFAEKVLVLGSLP